jgi:hypothetical protein
VSCLRPFRSIPKWDNAAVLPAFYDAQEITDSVYLIHRNVVNLKPGHMVFDRNHQFKPIKPIGPKVIAEAGFVRQTIWIDAKMSGDDLTDLDGKVVSHERLLAKMVR